MYIAVMFSALFIVFNGSIQDVIKRSNFCEGFSAEHSAFWDFMKITMFSISSWFHINWRLRAPISLSVSCVLYRYCLHYWKILYLLCLILLQSQILLLPKCFSTCDAPLVYFVFREKAFWSKSRSFEEDYCWLAHHVLELLSWKLGFLVEMLYVDIYASSNR